VAYTFEKRSLIMNKLAIIFVVGLLSHLAGLASPAQAELRLHYSTMFNPLTVETLKGEVARVEKFLAGNGRDYGVRAILETGREKIAVILGPVEYLEKQGLKIEPKNRVTVTGSRITIQGRPILIAMEVKGDAPMKLREQSGRPDWATEEDWHAR
jgi:hypothetical protein